MYLIGLEKRFEYKDESHRITTGIIDVNNFFQGAEEYNVKSSYPNGSFYQFGWNSAVQLKFNGKFMIIEKLVDFESEEETAVDGEFSVIATRAVDSCTFICVQKEDKYLLVHIDSCKGKNHDKLLKRLSELLKDFKDGEALISFIVDEEDYVNKVWEMVSKESTKVYLRKVDNIDKTHELAECMDVINIFGHMEIGLCAEHRKPTIFGDVTNHMRTDHQIPCYRFLGCEQFEAAIESIQHDL